jgi:hypothetical protein
MKDFQGMHDVLKKGWSESLCVCVRERERERERDREIQIQSGYV